MCALKHFTCGRCGECCKNLLSEDEGILRGLSLLPHETRRFPKSSVMPAIGVGSSPNEKDFGILLYQILNDTCPNLDGRNCTIYSDRPTSCRQYPFSLSLDDTSENILIGYDLNCPSLKRNVGAGIEAKNLREIEQAKNFLKVRLKMMLTKERLWYFDLHDKCWKQKRNIKAGEPQSLGIPY